MAATVAEMMVATLKASGVRRVYGVPGDSLNGFTDALRRDGGVAWQKSSVCHQAISSSRSGSVPP